MTTSTLSRKKVIWLILPLSLVLLLVLIPIAGKFAAMHLLKKQGATQAHIEDLDLNLFTGVFGIDNATITYEDLSSVELERLTLNLSLLALLSKAIKVQSLEIQGLTLKAVNQGDRLLLGLPIPLNAAPRQAGEAGTGDEADTRPWNLELPEITFRQLHLDYRQTGLQTTVVLDEVTLSDFSTNQINQALDFTLAGQVNGSPLALSVTGTPLATPSKLHLKIELERFPLASLQGLIRDQLPQLAGFLSLNTALEIEQADTGLTAKQYGAIALEDLAADLTGAAGQPLVVDAFDWSWTGQAQVDTDADFSPRVISTRGSMVSDDNRLQLGSEKLQVQLKGFSLNGDLHLRNLDISEQLQFKGDLLINRLQTESTQAGLQPIVFSDLALNDIAIQGLNEIVIKGFDVHNLAVGNPLPKSFPGEQALLKQQRLTLGTLRLDEQTRLTLDSVELDGLNASLHVGPQGNLPLLDALGKLADALSTTPAAPTGESTNSAGSPEKPPKENSAPFQFWIKDLQVAGNSTFSVRDQSVTPQYQQTLDITKLSLGNIRNDKPEEFMDLALQAKLDKHSSIDLNGKLQLFADKKNIDMKGRVRNVNLIKLSPYVAQQTGYNIHTGALDAKLDIKVKNDKLDVVNKLKLQNIKLIPDKQDKIEKLTKNLTMPLDQALNILRDKNNNVELEVPIEGDINNPEFGIQDVVNIAMTKALKSASVSYLKTFLQPYGTAIMVAQMVGNYAMKIRLEPLVFEPGTVVLNNAHHQYLDDLATRMQEKSALRLRACGLATPTESELTDPVEKENSLSALGEQRADHVRQYLVDKGIAADRLFTCNPEIDISENARARVELAM